MPVLALRNITLEIAILTQRGDASAMFSQALRQNAAAILPPALRKRAYDNADASVTDERRCNSFPRAAARRLGNAYPGAADERFGNALPRFVAILLGPMWVALAGSIVLLASMARRTAVKTCVAAGVRRRAVAFVGSLLV
eukprot:5887549-Pyramimonas_sp.AAC.1